MNVLVVFNLVCAYSEAENLFKLINRFRRSRGQYPLQRDQRLDAVARAKVIDDEKFGARKGLKRMSQSNLVQRLNEKNYLDVKKVCENSAAINSVEHDSAINMMTNLTEHSLWKEPLIDDYTDVGIAMIQNEDMGKKFWDVILARKEHSVEPPKNVVIEGTI